MHRVVKEDKVHPLLHLRIVVFKLCNDCFLQLFFLCYFLVESSCGIELKNVAKHDFVGLEEIAAFTSIPEAIAQELHHQVNKPGIVFVVDQPVTKYSESLVDPKTSELVFVEYRTRFGHQNALEHF